jgi:hypothetical protein
MIGLEVYIHVIGVLIWFVARSYSCLVFGLYLGCGILFHTVHRLGHDWKFSKKWYIAHTVGHHKYAYPILRFASQNSYIENKYDAKNLNVWAYVVTVGGFIALASIFIFSTWIEFIIDFSAAFALLLLENWVHNIIHFPTPWKAMRLKFPRLDKMILDAHDRHFLHHQKQYVHYAVVAWWFDSLLGTK